MCCESVAQMLFAQEGFLGERHASIAARFAARIEAFAVAQHDQVTGLALRCFAERHS